MTNQPTLSDKLRDLADWLETRPLIARHIGYLMSEVNAYAVDPDNWKALLAECGTFRKGSGADFLTATHTLPSGMTVTLNARHDRVCEQRQVGEREVEREVYPADVRPVTVTETEPVYEWVCPKSWIAA